MRPTLVLLHGWTATSDLNWQTSYAELADHYNVITLDITAMAEASDGAMHSHSAIVQTTLRLSYASSAFDR